MPHGNLSLYIYFSPLLTGEIRDWRPDKQRGTKPHSTHNRNTYFLKHTWISLSLKTRNGNPKAQLRVGSWIPGIFFIPSASTWDCGSGPAFVPAKELNVTSDTLSTALQSWKRSKRTAFFLFHPLQWHFQLKQPSAQTGLFTIPSGKFFWCLLQNKIIFPSFHLMQCCYLEGTWGGLSVPWVITVVVFPVQNCR